MLVDLAQFMGASEERRDLPTLGDYLGAPAAPPLFEIAGPAQAPRHFDPAEPRRWLGDVPPRVRTLETLTADGPAAGRECHYLYENYAVFWTPAYRPFEDSDEYAMNIEVRAVTPSARTWDMETFKVDLNHFYLEVVYYIQNGYPHDWRRRLLIGQRRRSELTECTNYIVYHPDSYRSIIPSFGFNGRRWRLYEQGEATALKFVKRRG